MKRRLRIAALVTLAIVTTAAPVDAAVGRRVSVTTADAFGTTRCGNVQPGALLQDANGFPYTMGFFYKGSDKLVYFATVGQFILTAPGTKTWKATKGPWVEDGRGKKIGHFAYAFREDTPNAQSFGLVRLDRKVHWSPKVCHFGGPTGDFTSNAATPFPVQFYGQAIPFDSFLPARSAIAITAASKDEIFAVGPAGVFFGLGDEGAPVLTGGKAVGFVTGALGGSGSVPPQAGAAIARMGPWIARASKAIHVKLSLQKSSPVGGGVGF